MTLKTSLLTAASAALVALAAPAAAHAACPTVPTSKAFAAWGDQRDYFVAPGGHFEGAHGWSLSGASVTAGNEPWRVRAAGDSKALTIAPGGSATSPAFCVGAEHPTFRLFATRGRGLYGMLNVSIVTANGTTQVAPVVDGKTGWKPSDDLMLSTVLADTYVGKTAAVRVKLSVDAASAPWTVDDVFVDPYRRG